MSYQPQSNNPYGQPGWNVSQSGGAPMYSGDAGMAEAGMPKNELGFNDQTIRSAFVRKVFTLVSIMLGVVTIMSAIPHFYKVETVNAEGKLDTYYPIRKYIQQHMGLYIAAMVVFFVVYLVLLCCDSVRRAHPTNLVCTGILTLAIGFMTATITSFYTLDSVVLALAVTTLSCVGIVVFAMTTKRDITSMMGFMFIAGLSLMLFGFFAIFWTMIFHTRTLYMVYCALGTLFFMVYLAIDIQMIMGGRKYEISPEEHIFAAIMLFMDIVQIFWFILSLIGDRS